MRIALRCALCIAVCALALALHAEEDSPPAQRAMAVAPPPSTVAASWQHAIVFIPGKRRSWHPYSAAADKPLPVVLYMHGCAGISAQHDLAWGRYLESLGYVVVLPDSFARSDRKADCDPVKRTGGFFPQAHVMRLEEIEYAMEQLKHQAWADSRNIFLMGHSEGGQAAVMSYPEGFRGIILSGTYVYSDAADSDLILAPEETPILSLVWGRDLWSGEKLRSDANNFSRHRNSRMVVFNGAGHETYAQPRARQAVADFLKQNTEP
jgi:dienelactone hydrolase